MKQQTYSFQFVQFMPKPLEEGVLDVLMDYANASHRCFCNCGIEMVTPPTCARTGEAGRRLLK